VRIRHGPEFLKIIYFLFLSVLDPPKNVSVSISPSGEIVEGSSVTLTCSSDGNPPEKNYTWFKEGGTSPVGSGQNYSFSLNPRSDGLYYCEAQNEYGSLRSASVPVVLNVLVVLNGERLDFYFICTNY
uniref:Ig-like domain-containing protein n=1 Tax=Pygocentrus nattereri TaxID=42514 RepID=A0A3B4EDB3_PYGNA